RPDQRFDDCVEVGTRYQSRLPGFQVDRAKLDSHMLELAVQAGCELWRPAKVTNFELNNDNGQKVSAALNGSDRTVHARWVIDATGRATMLARKLGHFRPNTEHPINAVWARFSGVKEWDSYEWRQRFPDYANNCRTAREWATNHLFGRGWWVWIIPLHGGDVSAGIVYDSRIFKFPEGPTLGQRLHTRILAGEDVTERISYYNQQYPITYRYWFESLYKDKYYYMGDAELMSAALLLDVSSYYIGLVRSVYHNAEREFLNLPFTGVGGRL